MKWLTFVLLLIPCVLSLGAQPVPADFLADIDQLQELIETKHVDPFRETSRKAFHAIVKKAREIISDKDKCDQSCYVELCKIIAVLRDGHSGMDGNTRYSVFGYLPFSVRWFGEELYVVRAAEPYRGILGTRIEKVNGKDIKQVLDLLRTAVPHSNESRFKKLAGRYLHLPGFLFGLGIAGQPDRATFTFANETGTFERTLLSISPEQEKNTPFVSYQDEIDNLPLHLRKDDYYWFNYDPDKKLLYFQYNRIGNMKTESAADFARRLWAFADSVTIDKFVLDLRYNGGGSFPYSLRFLRGILDRPAINRRGKLFVITGYDTFSAAIILLNLLEAQSEAIIVGEPPCHYPAHPGDAETYELDRTGVRVSLSSLFHPTPFPSDGRRVTLLDKKITPQWQDYLSGRDPVMDYIHAFERPFKDQPKSADFQPYLGYYAYTLDKHLLVRDQQGQLWLEITHSLQTPLYLTGSRVFNTEIQGLSVELKKRRIKVRFPDGSSQTFPKIEESPPSAIEWIYRGDFTRAAAAYRQIQAVDPGNIELKDHQFSFLATMVYFELASTPGIDAAAYAREILNLGIDLNKGEAPFCEFSLRFYP